MCLRKRKNRPGLAGSKACEAWPSASDDLFQGEVVTLASNGFNGARAPVLVDKDMVGRMKAAR